MDHSEINRGDIRLYRRLITLSQKQLAIINARLSGNTGKEKHFWFQYRNRRIKKIIVSILDTKQARVGDNALREMVDDLKRIEADQNDWPEAGKEELDYIQILLHGLADMSELENND